MGRRGGRGRGLSPSSRSAAGGGGAASSRVRGGPRSGGGPRTSPARRPDRRRGAVRAGCGRTGRRKERARAEARGTARAAASLSRRGGRVQQSRRSRSCASFRRAAGGKASGAAQAAGSVHCAERRRLFSDGEHVERGDGREAVRRLCVPRQHGQSGAVALGLERRFGPHQCVGALLRAAARAGGGAAGARDAGHGLRDGREDDGAVLQGRRDGQGQAGQVRARLPLCQPALRRRHSPLPRGWLAAGRGARAAAAHRISQDGL